MELVDRMMAKYPKLMTWDFECPQGWETLVKSLLDELATLNEPDLQVDQIKSKYGGLRCYLTSTSDAAAKIVSRYEMESLKTCEVCGAPGKKQGKSWIRTVCDVHQ
jgi:hypothetical protein